MSAKFRTNRQALNQKFKSYIEGKVDSYPVETRVGEGDGEIIISRPIKENDNPSPYVQEVKYPILRPLIDDLKSEFS